ncbi:unnamed protein product [Cochlearia groenlandica]
MNYDGRDNSGNEQYNSLNVMNKGKKISHRHSPQQIQILETFFKECPHPDESQRERLCGELKLEPDQIKFWFQNKRTQCKVQDERSTNIMFRGENQNMQCEIGAMVRTLMNSLCVTCDGPSFGSEERKRNFQKLRFDNAQLKDERDRRVSFVCENSPNPPNMVGSLTSQNMYGPNHQNNHMEPQTNISEEEIRRLYETATNATEELKQLFLREEDYWVKSTVDGSYMIDHERYKKFSHSLRHFRSLSSRVESSKDVTVVPIEATHLIQIFLDSEKWKKLFPTIVNNAKTLHVVESEIPITQNYNVLQVIWEQLHIVSPLVTPREFVILRCCQKIDNGIWMIADVSHQIDNFDIINASCCYKRPSGCLIQALSNSHTKVTWIEHVEVDDKSETHAMYRKLVNGRSGYGAKRWIVTLERMCERMALTSILTFPASDFSHVIRTSEARSNVMKIGERMLKAFNEMLTMSGKVDFPMHSKNGVRISIRVNNETGQLPGLVITAASFLAIPLAPLHVFNCMRNLDTRHQWDVLSYGNVVSEIARIFTGSSETNSVTILQPKEEENNNNNNTGMTMMNAAPMELDKRTMLMIQDTYFDSLGGMLVYAPIDMASMKLAISGQVNHSNIPILPSGFIISSDGGHGSTAADGDGGSTLLTVAFQILMAANNYSPKERMMRRVEVDEKIVHTVTTLISTTLQRIKRFFNCPQ